MLIAFEKAYENINPKPIPQVFLASESDKKNWIEALSRTNYADQIEQIIVTPEKREFLGYGRGPMG